MSSIAEGLESLGQLRVEGQFHVRGSWFSTLQMNLDKARAVARMVCVKK
jgi:hypothetical protein